MWKVTEKGKLTFHQAVELVTRENTVGGAKAMRPKVKRRLQQVSVNAVQHGHYSRYGNNLNGVIVVEGVTCQRTAGLK